MQIKNLLKADDEGIKRKKLERWNTSSPQTQEHVRAGLLKALVTAQPEMAKSVASAIAALASIEVPRGGWPALLQTLFTNVSSEEVPVSTKVASLETLGFTCESIEVGDIPKPIVDQILNTVVSGMAVGQDNKMKLAAIQALINSIDFTQRNFALEQERDAIMDAVCVATQCEDVRVREAAYECLANIANEFYSYLRPYMERLFHFTSIAISGDEDSVKKMAMEFWTSIFETEIELDEEDYSLEIGAEVAAALVPLLLQALTQQTDIEDDEEENGEWDVAAAGQVCLQALADDIDAVLVEHVMPFITANIHGDWRQKDAAIFAYGILMGCATEHPKVKPYIQDSIQMLAVGLQDKKGKVRDTCAWTLGQLLVNQRAHLGETQINLILNSLLHSIDDRSSVVSRQAINALLNYAASFSDQEEDEEPQTNGLSSCFQVVVTKLLTITESPECKVRNDAYEAASVFIENSALDQVPFVLQVLNEAINRLETSFTAIHDNNDRATSQSLICGVMNGCFRKLPAAAINSVVDRGMQNILNILNYEGPSAQEEAFMAIGFICDKLGDAFDRYTVHVSPYLIRSLGNPDEHALFTPTITAVSAMCKSCIQSMLPFTDKIVEELLAVLLSPNADRSLKPNVIGVFCDMSMNMRGAFERYLESVLKVLQIEQLKDPENNDEETIEYIEQLRLSIFEAYTGITHGLNEGGKPELLLPYIDGIFAFISKVVEIEHVSDELLSSAVGLIGDLARYIGRPVFHYLSTPVIQKAVREATTRGGRENNLGLRDTANYTLGFMELIRKQGGVVCG